MVVESAPSWAVAKASLCSGLIKFLDQSPATDIYCYPPGMHSLIGLFCSLQSLLCKSIKVLTNSGTGGVSANTSRLVSERTLFNAHPPVFFQKRTSWGFIKNKDKER